MRLVIFLLAPFALAACSFGGHDLPIIEQPPPDQPDPMMSDPDRPVIAGPHGVLDPSFGTEGIARDFRGSVSGIAVAADETIFVNGTYYSEAGRSMAVAHYSADGDVDTSFGSGGILDTTHGPFPDSNADAVALVAENDGTLYAVGRIVVPEPDAFRGMAIVALNPNGNAEHAFGDAGNALRIVTSRPPADAVPIDAVLTPSGALAIAGFIPGQPPTAFIARFNEMGNMNGAVTHGDRTRITAIAAQPDGKVIAGGYVFEPDVFQDVAVFRTDAKGVLDPTFADQGKLIIDLEAIDVVTDVAVQPDGKILVTGNTVNVNGFPRSFLIRLMPDGSADLDFGDRAVVALDNVGIVTTAQLAIAENGDIYVGGEVRWDGFTHLMLLRYTGQGWLDNSFGREGMITFDTLETPSYLARMMIDKQGRVLLGGASGDVVHFFLTRVLP